MKIYTRAGDKGRTQMVGHQVVDKDDDRVEAYGTIDELNSVVGFTAATLTAQTQQLHDELEELQQLLFDVGYDLAKSANVEKPFKFTTALSEKSTAWLEEKIDDYTAASPKVKKFILPGGSSTSASLHVARTITRRAERRIVSLQKKSAINPAILPFINRLSDYFFAAARFANTLSKTPDVLYRNSKDVFR